MIPMTTPGLNDQTFMTQFENLTLDPIHFSHLGHLRLGWLYLAKHDQETAVGLVCRGIRTYAESLGANQKFHVTITRALMLILAQRYAATSHKVWSRFPDQNRDLVEDALAILLNHYSRELLFSETARTSWVQPDLKPFPVI